MEHIRRYIESKIQDHLGSNKVLLIFGTRRVGKTFLVNKIREQYKGKVLMLNAEDFDVQDVLKKRTIANYQLLTAEASLLILDEAQTIENVGAALKLMIDSQPNLTIIATGSSSLDLVNSTGEPLTGRQIPFQLFPIAQLELKEDWLTTKSNLDERLIFGSYPEVFQLSTTEKKAAYLTDLTRSYLLKDVLAYSGIKYSNKLQDLLRMIAYQVGAEVSYNELSRKLGINKTTIENYLDLLQKVFILYKLPSYSNHPRKEITKGVKWYFYDNGIRNAMIQDFRTPSLRNDIGMLWENYIISERIKRNSYKGELRQLYFWRTYNQQEIDLIEVYNGSLTAFEIKYGVKNRNKFPLGFRTTYPEAECKTINSENYLDFII
jgi:predicted AAA+ superfamily ATPase